MARLFLIGTMLVWLFVFVSFQRSRLMAGSLAAEHTRMDAEGEVSDVNCSGVEMTLKIAASNGKFKLHARDYTRVEISEDASPFQAGEFKPCAELNGKTAKITFVTVDRKAYDGEIQSIEVEK
jgi:hypothetical protein